MADIKWSAFVDAGAITSGDDVVGLRGGVNVRLTANAFDNLLLDTNTLSSTDAAGDINITPDTTGDLVLDGLKWPQADGSASTLLTTDGLGQLSFTTATFPGTAGSAGTILRSDGSDWVASTSTFADTYAASTILYSNGANTVAALATANDGLLVTSATGVPSIGNAILADITVTGVKIGRGNAPAILTNTALGGNTLSNVTTAGLCTAVGQSAGAAITDGAGNTAIGYSSLISLSTGNDNVSLGERSGRNTAGGIAATLTTGDNNTFLGTHATSDAAGASGTIAIGKNAIANSATGATSGDDGPSLAIGSAGYPVGFRGDASLYPAAGTSAGYVRIKLNGVNYKMLLLDDV
jgi:hypothetical protein